MCVNTRSRTFLVQAWIYTNKIRYYSTAAPTVTYFQRVWSTTNFTLTCTSTNSPATTVTWMRDGTTLPINGAKNHFYQTVTSRRSSTYQNTLVVDDDIENVTGNYSCKVTNTFGSYTSSLNIRGKGSSLKRNLYMQHHGEREGGQPWAIWAQISLV